MDANGVEFPGSPAPITSMFSARHPPRFKRAWVPVRLTDVRVFEPLKGRPSLTSVPVIATVVDARI